MSRHLDLASSWAKAGRGKHLKIELANSIAKWSRFRPHPPITFGKKLEQDRHAVLFFIDQLKPVEPDWSLILGDALNNYRAALDHLAWQLYLAGSAFPAIPKRERRIAFPSYPTSRKDFLLRVGNKELLGVSQRRIARLSPFQPYTRRNQANRGVATTIAELARLTNTDKHRELLVARNRPPGAHLKFIPGIGGRRVEWLIQTRTRLTPGAKVVRVYAYPGVTLKDQMRMEPEFTPQITLDGGIEPIAFLNLVDRSVRVVLRTMAPS